MTTPTPPKAAELVASLRATADDLEAWAATLVPNIPAPNQPAAAVPARPPAPRVTPATPDGLRLDVPADLLATLWRWRDELDTTSPIKDLTTKPFSIRSAMTATSRPRRYSVQAGNSAGWSDWSPPVDVPAPAVPPAPGGLPSPSPAPRPTPTPPAPPASPYAVLRGDWYLTLPVGKPEAPRTVQRPELDTFTDEHYALTPARDAVVFTAPCGGVTTKGSDYPRSELRQTRPDGSLASWDNLGSGQTLIIEEAFTKLPTAKPEVVGAQIHDTKSDVIEVMLSGQTLLVRWADGKLHAVLDPAYVLGTRYRLDVIAARGGIAVAYNGRTAANLRISGSGWYWKVGCYVQSNPSKGDRPDAVGQVVVYRAEVTT